MSSGCSYYEKCLLGHAPPEDTIITEKHLQTMSLRGVQLLEVEIYFNIAKLEESLTFIYILIKVETHISEAEF